MGTVNPTYRALVSPTGSAVSAAGKWDGEIPGKRACDPGLYTARILDVTAPAQTNMVWNENASELESSITLEVKAQ